MQQSKSANREGTDTSFNQVQICCKQINKAQLRTAVLSVRFEVGVPLFLAPAGADKRAPKAPFPLVENAGIQLAIYKRVPAGALAGAGSY